MYSSLSCQWISICFHHQFYRPWWIEFPFVIFPHVILLYLYFLFPATFFFLLSVKIPFHLSVNTPFLLPIKILFLFSVVTVETHAIYIKYKCVQYSSNQVGIFFCLQWKCLRNKKYTLSRKKDLFNMMLGAFGNIKFSRHYFIQAHILYILEPCRKDSLILLMIAYIYILVACLLLIGLNLSVWSIWNVCQHCRQQYIPVWFC